MTSPDDDSRTAQPSGEEPAPAADPPRSGDRGATGRRAEAAGQRGPAPSHEPVAPQGTAATDERSDGERPGDERSDDGRSGDERPSGARKRSRSGRAPRATGGAPVGGPGLRQALRASQSRDGEEAGEAYADRVFRSTSSLVAGVLLLALGAWLGGDALVRGHGRTPWLALCGLVFAVPLVAAFTVRPIVSAGADRLLVRNPFRTLTLPWGTVEGVRAGYSSEVLAGGRTYQMWAIPVSLRQRKAASRRQARAIAQDPYGKSHEPARTPADSLRAPSDQAIEDLRELAERHASRPAAQGALQVRWAYELIVPIVLGAVALAVVWAVA